MPPFHGDVAKWQSSTRRRLRSSPIFQPSARPSDERASASPRRGFGAIRDPGLLCLRRLQCSCRLGPAAAWAKRRAAARVRRACCPASSGSRSPGSTCERAEIAPSPERHGRLRRAALAVPRRRRCRGLRHGGAAGSGDAGTSSRTGPSRPRPRPRPTARRTARSSRWPARSNAATGSCASSVTTTLGSALMTVLIRHATSAPPRGPLTSSKRTLSRSIRGANLPRRQPSRLWMHSRSSGSTVSPEVRTAKGVLGA
jgi:hypothetical protein